MGAACSGSPTAVDSNAIPEARGSPTGKGCETGFQNIRDALKPFTAEASGKEESMTLLSSLASSDLFQGGNPIQLGSRVGLGLDMDLVVVNIARCVHYILHEAVVVLETARDEEEQTEGTKASLPFETATEILQTRVEDSGNEGEEASDVQAGIRVLCILYAAFGKPLNDADQSHVPLHKFWIESINQIFSLLFPSICQPSAGMEVQGEVLERLGSFRKILNLLGVTTGEVNLATVVYSGIPFPVLDSSSKGKLLYVESCFMGQSRLVLSGIDRESVLEDTLQKLRDADVHFNPGEKAPPKFYKLFPFFKVAGSFSMEGGEGHGPRKEQFDLTAQELMQEYGPWHTAKGAFLDMREGSQASVSCPGGRWDMSTLCVGMRLKFDLGGETITSTITDIKQMQPSVVPETGQSEGMYLLGKPKCSEVILRLDHTSEEVAGGLEFSYQRATQPLFRLDPTGTSAYCWFNGSLEVMTAKRREDKKKFSDKFALAGWLAAQAIANGVTLPLPLPLFLFKALLSGNGNLAVTEADLAEVDQDNARAFQRIRELSPEEFHSILELEDAPKGTTKDQWIQAKVAETLCSKVIAEEYNCFRAAFFGSGLLRSKVFRELTPIDLQTLVIGRPDNGRDGFEFGVEFRFVLDPEFTRLSYNKILFEAFRAVAEKRFQKQHEGISLQRTLLKFITGRTLLPARKGEEVIRIELPYTTVTPDEYNWSMERLPQSHTCDNTLEIPNYFEALLFNTSSSWFAQKRENHDAPPEVEPQKMYITDAEKERTVKALSEDRLQSLKVELEDRLYQKLLLACMSSDTYDLDEIPSTVPPPVGNVKDFNTSASEEDLTGSDKESNAESPTQDGPQADGVLTVDELPQLGSWKYPRVI